MSGMTGTPGGGVARPVVNPNVPPVVGGGGPLAPPPSQLIPGQTWPGRPQEPAVKPTGMSAEERAYRAEMGGQGPQPAPPRMSGIGPGQGPQIAPGQMSPEQAAYMKMTPEQQIAYKKANPTPPWGASALPPQFPGWPQGPAIPPKVY